MVLTGVEWVRELATLCSHDTAYQIFKTLAVITEKLIELLFWGAPRRAVYTAFFQARDLFTGINVWHDP